MPWPMVWTRRAYSPTDRDGTSHIGSMDLRQGREVAHQTRGGYTPVLLGEERRHSFSDHLAHERVAPFSKGSATEA